MQCVEGQILQMFLYLTNLSGQLGTVVTGFRGCTLGGRGVWEVLSSKESVNFSFQQSDSFCQYMGFR